MPPLESTIHRPASPDIEEPALTSRRFYRQGWIESAAKFSLRTRTAKAALQPLIQFSPWLASLVYPLFRGVIIPTYFRKVEVSGQENLPLSGPVILAPTHRSRWDAFMVPYAAGHHITGRHLHFMVSSDEVVGFQGWLIQRLGGFPVDTNRPAIASLRRGVELLRDGETLVLFPEGDVFRGSDIQPLKPGLARLALQAEAIHPSLGIQIVPIHIHYSHPGVPWKTRVRIQIGDPLPVTDYRLDSLKIAAQHLTIDLLAALRDLSHC